MDWTSYTLWSVIGGSSILGVVGGMVGSFAVLKRQSLLGDALAHAALPGVCLAFLLVGEKAPIALLCGAMATGMAGALFVVMVVRWSKIKEDSAIGIVLSVFFAVGIVLLTKIMRLPGGNQSGLDKYLFGQAATIVAEDVLVLACITGVVLVVVAVLYKELKLLTFDREFGASIGFPMRALDILLTSLLVLVVVAGLETVGVVLMVATLITPAAAARQWTDRLGVMLIVAGALGGVSCAAGTLLSAFETWLPPGPTIVLVSSGVLVVSLLLAPRRGMLWAWFRERAVARRIRRENLLKDLYLIGEREKGWKSFVTLPVLMGLRGRGALELERNIRRLISSKLLERSADALRLTPEGVEEAEQVVRKHRLWEVYLTRRLELPSDHVHRDAEAMEHALSEATVADFEERLGFPTVDPHGRPIPSRRRQ
ncbi:MAG TPA: iron chelate uptake ABC transporter family permease subunit [Planctomycetota bacterium]|nr:iron chelate uptake ABC transporter family permease subunit [Planctomycetota bacterium]